MTLGSFLSEAIDWALEPEQADRTYATLTVLLVLAFWAAAGLALWALGPRKGIEGAMACAGLSFSGASVTILGAALFSKHRTQG